MIKIGEMKMLYSRQDGRLRDSEPLLVIQKIPFLRDTYGQGELKILVPMGDCIDLLWQIV